MKPRANGIAVRRALTAWIRSGNAPTASGVVLEELDVGNGRARADVAVVNDVATTAIEIKGDGDDLKRLPRQVRAFDVVADYCVLVARASTLATARALRVFDRAVVPDRWGLLAFDVGETGVVFEWVRRPQARPPDVVASLRFLWRRERLALLCRHGLARGNAGLGCWALAEKIKAELAPDVILAFVRERLRVRVHLFPENRELPARPGRFQWVQCRACGYRVKPEAMPCASCGA